MKICIYCGSQNKEHKSNCKQCGAPLFIQESVDDVSFKSITHYSEYVHDMGVFPNAWCAIIFALSPFLLILTFLYFYNIFP